MLNDAIITYDNHANAALDDYHKAFAIIWERDESERSVFDLWFHVVDHASRIARAVRRQEPPGVVDDIADTFVWLLSFVAHCQRCAETAESRFYFSESPSEIVWQKYPGTCPACFDSWILEELDIEKDETPIRKFDDNRKKLYEKIELRAKHLRESAVCNCLTRSATHMRERQIVSSLRVELDECRLHYAELTSDRKIQALDDLEHMFEHIYANVHHVVSLDHAVFHLLEEIGEATEALKDLYTYDNSREPYSVKLHQYRKNRVLDELADVFSWLFATAIKIRSTYSKHASLYRESIRPSSVPVEESMYFSDIIWAKYGATKSGANWDQLKCPGCQSAPCECPRDIRYVWHQPVAEKSKTSLQEMESRMTQTNRDIVFISYSHKDAEWLDRLHVMLKPMVRKNNIAIWDDKQIHPGQNWRSEIESALTRAKVAVLLVSPNFLSSDFIDDHELPPLLEAAEKEGATVIWIPVSHALFEQSDIARFQAAFNPGTPLDSLSPSDVNKVLKQVCIDIQKAYVGGS